MNRIPSLRHEFVTYMPDIVDAGVLYVSIPFATVVHACCCGCGNEVVTPLDPDGWKLTFDGKTISLSPSIGNWALDCQSHYWISRNQVRWARNYPLGEGKAGRSRNRIARMWQYAGSQVLVRIRKVTRG